MSVMMGTVCFLLMGGRTMANACCRHWRRETNPRHRCRGGAACQPGGPAELALPAQLDFRHLVGAQYQRHVPHERIARVIAHDRHEPMKTQAARQQPLVVFEAQRAEHHAKLVLAAPDAFRRGARSCRFRLSRGRRPGDVAASGSNVNHAPIRLSTRTGTSKKADRICPSPSAFRGLRGEQSREMQFREIRHGIAVMQARTARPIKARM
jgi:hypothetical protein